MLNLLIHYDKKAWDKTSAYMEKDRCFTEYISLGLKKQFSDWSEESIEKIKKIPCLFAYEKSMDWMPV